MSTLRAGDREFHTLPAGHVLTVVAAAASAGLVRQYPDSGFNALSPATAVGAGATVTVGPFTGSVRLGVEATTGTVTWEAGPPAPASALSDTQTAAAQAVVSGGGNDYIRWCIPGRDTSGTVFKDTSGKGNDATIDASNSGAFATDARMATVVHVSAGGITQSLAASLCDLATDSIVFAVSMTRADPAANDAVISWGAGAATGFPGFYVSHRLSAAGVGRAIGNRGNNTLVSGSDTTVKFSNAGGTRETHMVVAYDAPTGSLYLYRDGVLAAANAGLMTGANAFTQTVITSGARLGAIAGGAAVVSVFRGWQGYVFAGKGLPINIGRIAAMLAEAPSTPLRDYEFQFAA